MYQLKLTDEFTLWLKDIRDSTARQRLIKRLRKASMGHLGDVKPVGSGVFEMREHFGPGWRMYFSMQGNVLVIMLGGGDKSTQSADIAKSIELAARLRG